ncbi:MAG: AmpG family muropeptide MFS transporter [Alphaproteobacteria bacterium]|nr:AmpG family muropeptide MFS transporter [Alphaproteobacteria bacterium]
MSNSPKKFFDSMTVYFQPRLIIMLLLGFSSGVPISITGDIVTWWLAGAGVCKTSIGFFCFMTLPYMLKPLWAPIVDQMNPPFFLKRFGQRKGWLLLCQIVLILLIALMGQGDPKDHIELMGLFALLVVICSATQDIIIDAYRIEFLNASEYTAGASVSVLGYRIAMLVTGSLGLLLSDYLSWPVVYLILAGFMLVGLVTTFFCQEPARVTIREKKSFLEWVKISYLGPLRDFAQRKGWQWILLFILLYYFGDQLIGRMSRVFYKELGFSGTEVAFATKTMGLWIVVVGGFVGATLAFRVGLMRAMFISSVFHMLSNFSFIFMAYIGHSLFALYLTVTLENLSAGMMSSCLVSYISHLCNRSFSATQYALLSSLSSVPRVFFSPLLSGPLAERFDWVTFFLVATAGALPGIFILLLLMKKFPIDGKRVSPKKL